jgi:adenine-specific DNA-methyltransferase
MQNLINDLEALLQQDQSLISDGNILKNAVIERAAKMDAGLLRLLIQSDTIRKHFFVEVEGTLIFDKARFQDFVSNKAFLPDSYTAFKNRIGLTDARGYLKESRDVVLAWPYKDCVLEGGQTKEDKARQEVFWNTTLAPDDISRLFEPKVLTGFERWDAEAVAAGVPKPVEQIADDDNLLIKGNNLLALHSLKARYAGAVKLIYIDPPYNTGSDDFLYNDRFNHASWLTFMKNRLLVARDLLRSDGSIFVSIGDVEGHYLKVLMDEVFGRDNFLATFIWQKVDSPNDNKPAVAPDHEFVLCYEKIKKRAGFRQRGDDSILDSYVTSAKEPRLHRDRILRKNGKSSMRSDRESMWFPLSDPDGNDLYPIRDDGQDGRWSHGKRGVAKLKKENRLIWKKVPNAEGVSSWVPYAREFAPSDPSKPHSTILLDVKTSRQAQSHASEIFGSDPHLETIKPEQLVARIMELGSRKGDLVLDFFVGSGTTAAVAMKLGRRVIAVEQMDYARTMTCHRLKKVIGGETGGVSEDYGWDGGGSFVYAEFARWNARLTDDIRDAADATALAHLRDRLQTEGYVRPGVELDGLADAAFDALPLDDQKRVLIDCLDANHLYVNYGDIADEAYGISDEDMRVNRAFYGDKA